MLSDSRQASSVSLQILRTYFLLEMQIDSAKCMNKQRWKTKLNETKLISKLTTVFNGYGVRALHFPPRMCQKPTLCDSWHLSAPGTVPLWLTSHTNTSSLPGRLFVCRTPNDSYCSYRKLLLRKNHGGNTWGCLGNMFNFLFFLILKSLYWGMIDKKLYILNVFNLLSLKKSVC